MLFGITYEGDNSKHYKLVFSSDVASYHFRIGKSVSKTELSDMLEHVTADCKMFRGNAKTSHALDDIDPPKKKLARFILFRHWDKKKHEEEKNTKRTDLKEINEKNEKTIKDMLDSSCDSFKITQSLSLPTSDSVDDFYRKKKITPPPQENKKEQDIKNQKTDNI